MKTYIKEILVKREKLENNKHTFFSDEICKKIKLLDVYNKAKSLLMYYPYNSEADILPLAKKAVSEGKNVYFPKVTGQTSMEFVKVNSLSDFTNGYKGIKEPVGDVIFDKYAIKDEVVMILPGSVFDLSRNRCGYGKGYYDRYLADCYNNIVKIGVCFSIQMLESIPTEDIKITDIQMDYVINEEQIIGSYK